MNYSSYHQKAYYAGGATDISELLSGVTQTYSYMIGVFLPLEAESDSCIDYPNTITTSAVTVDLGLTDMEFNTTWITESDISLIY